MSVYDEWGSREKGEAWSREYTSLGDALRAAEKSKWLVTERVPIGDPRLLLVEDLADGMVFLSDGREVPAETLRVLQEEGLLLDLLVQLAKEHVKEAKGFEFFKRARAGRRVDRGSGEADGSGPEGAV